ncbi:MAG: alpha-glucosidase [Clostridia bacterium]
MLTKDSSIGDLLKNPIGCDVIGRLTQYAGIPAGIIDHPLTRAVKLRTLPKLAKGMVDENLLETLLQLFNQDEGEVQPLKNDERPWWKSAVVYQIYPRSFMDSNADGVGDLPGILVKLDYLQALGVTALWLSPVYDSPNDDNGYDVRDYRSIMADFGTMADMERLIAELHRRNMRLIMDLVLNHTSDEHPWFLESLKNPSGPYGDYYIWRKGADEKTPPNNWLSLFSGPAWTYYPERDEWAMHLFSKKQMDLNWENPAVRKDVFDIVDFWRDKGVDGFRLDVISFISKNSLADGNEKLGQLLGIRGVEHYFYGKNLHVLLQELKANAFHDAFTIGETPGTGPEMNRLLSAPQRQELSTVFCFDHMENIGKNRFDDYRYDLNHLKRCLIAYEGAYADVSWPTIFTENHDNPRMPSKIDPRPEYRERIAKLLCVLLLTARGTVFLYQGQELGAVNVDFSDIMQLKDVESLNRYRELMEAEDAQAWRHILAGTRDHARTPMQWTGERFGGFSTAEPWIRMGNPELINAADETNDPESVLNFYRAMIALRLSHTEMLVYGSFAPLHQKRRDLFCYERGAGAGHFYIEANLSDHEIAKPRVHAQYTHVIGNYPEPTERLRPYEAQIYRVL